MKKIKIIYWVATGLFIASMLSAAIPEILNGPDGIKFMAQLGYPAYLNPFLGVTKILGIIAILIPGYPRIKEWAYAGFIIDLVGATYSQVASKMAGNGWIFMIIFFIPVIVSYIYYHKKIAIHPGSTN